MRNINKSLVKTKRLFLSKVSLGLIICVILVMLMATGIKAQGLNQSASETGSLMFSRGMPILELRLLDARKISTTVFPGMQFRTDVVVKNNGKLKAVGCELIVETSSARVISSISDQSVFDLEPGDSVVRSVSYYVNSDAQPEPFFIEFKITEKNGYNLFPDRSLGMSINEMPASQVMVTDFAIRDQSGIGYFDVFSDVELFFRIQNCGQNPVSEINARISPGTGVIPRQLNPNFYIGHLSPGEYRDVSGIFSTSLESENLSVDINVDHGLSSTTQNFALEFRQDYKSVDRLSDAKCNQFIGALSSVTSGQDSVTALRPKSLQPQKFVIVISNKKYFALDSLHFADNDAKEFIELMKSHIGVPEGNIVYINGMFRDVFNDLDNIETVRQLGRKIRRSSIPAELIFYFIGYGSADFYSGNTYLLPLNYSKHLHESRIDLVRVYDWLETFRTKNRAAHVTAFFNLSFIERSISGSKEFDQFNVIGYHQERPWVTSIFSSSFQHLSHEGYSPEESIFNKALIRGLKGDANLNNDNTITAFELYRFQKDEAIGIPAVTWELHRSYSTPMFLGANRVLY